jgi:hypothetical protein
MARASSPLQPFFFVQAMPIADFRVVPAFRCPLSTIHYYPLSTIFPPLRATWRTIWRTIAVAPHPSDFGELPARQVKRHGDAVMDRRGENANERPLPFSASASLHLFLSL